MYTYRSKLASSSSSPSRWLTAVPAFNWPCDFVLADLPA